MPMFADSRNLTFYGGTFTDSTHHGMSGLQYLQSHIAAGAMHDSAERYPPPRCHPETRRAINHEIMDWIEDTNRSTKILWLNGPAGAGKSAIAQTIAELYSSSEKFLEPYDGEIGSSGKKLNAVLGASFFFSRSTSGRNSPKLLFPTIAAQLTMSIPEIASYIQTAVERNSGILDKSVDIQLHELIIKPLQSPFTGENQPNLRSTFVIIDGLDECLGEDSQAFILKLITSAIIEGRIPLYFLICSRPESWLKDTFDSSLLNELTRRLMLTHTASVDDDIRIVLRAGFTKIKQNPKHKWTMRSISGAWPSYSQIEEIVRRSSGQFIYASTILKYVDDLYFRPTDRLQDVITAIKGRTLEASPESSLDELYSYILSQCPKTSSKTLADILGMLLVLMEFPNEYTESCLSTTTQLAIIEDLLFLQRGDAHRTLRVMHSLIDLPDESDSDNNKNMGPHFFHASFPDFLQTKKRSGVYSVEFGATYARMVCSCLKIISGQKIHRNKEDYFVCAFAVRHWLKLLYVASGYNQSRSTMKELSSSLENFDIVHCINVAVGEKSAVPGGIDMWRDVLQLLQWNMDEISHSLRYGKCYDKIEMIQENIQEEIHNINWNRYITALDQPFIQHIENSSDPLQLSIILGATANCPYIISFKTIEGLLISHMTLYELLKPMKLFIKIDPDVATGGGSFYMSPPYAALLYDSKRMGKYFVTADMHAWIAMRLLHMADIKAKSRTFCYILASNIQLASYTPKLLHSLYLRTDLLLRHKPKLDDDLYYGREKVFKWLQRYEPQSSNIRKYLLRQWNCNREYEFLADPIYEWILAHNEFECSFE